MNDKEALVKTNNKTSLKTEKVDNVSKKSNFKKHFILGSLISLLIGVSYLYFRNNEINISNIKGKILKEIIHHEVRSIQGDFGEEVPVDGIIDDRNIIIEEIENAEESEEELLAQYDDEAEEELEETDDEDDRRFVEEMNELLKEDVNYELDEGFSQNDKDDNTNYPEEIVDDPEIAEYEHEVDDIIDNNWSDDEAELKRMESEVVHQ
ncbi:hypothetical protein RS030_6842 [Cryptosporidium xiaoi]|uniref:Uncharacterized protein n=1 Tax=Cryptosporidium xiaoi TaxID=659607 RepID=A0AAV9XVY1_9CRYT